VAAVDSLEKHCKDVAYWLGKGLVVPFLGAGANLLERPAGYEWQDDGKHLPSGAELAGYLADPEKPYDIPEDDRKPPLDLLRVSQWVVLRRNEMALVRELHTVFERNYPPNRLHRFLAGLPGALRAKGSSSCGQLLLTTNYDDLLERAFAEANGGEGEPVDVVAYEVKKDGQRFVHLRPDGERVPIEDPDTYRPFELEKRSVILKIHGHVDKDDFRHDTFVVTEDDYIDYLAGKSVRELIPAQLMAQVQDSNICFLGYSMRDWNLRVILRQIWTEQTFATGAWSIQLHPSEMDKEFWDAKGIEVRDLALENWVEGMKAQLGMAAKPA
jgi:hypothetical protein